MAATMAATVAAAAAAVVVVVVVVVVAAAVEMEDDMDNQRCDTYRVRDRLGVGTIWTTRGGTLPLTPSLTPTPIPTKAQH